MLTISRGRIKTYFLILLIISSLILSGSLWFEDYHGFSAFFAKFSNMTFSRLINMGKDDLEIKCSKAIIPRQIIVNDGEEGHWILYPSEDKYSKLWTTVKSMFKNISTSQARIRPIDIKKEEWDGLLVKRSIVLDFNYPLNQEILSLLLETNGVELNQAVLDVEGIAVTKFGQEVVLYIKKGGESSLYQKLELTNQEGIDDKDFEEIFTDASLIRYAFLPEAFGSKGNDYLAYGERVFAPTFVFSDSRKKAVRFNEVEFKPEISANSEKEINQLAHKFLNGGDYTYFIKSDGTHLFIDERNNTLKVYSDGLVEFEYSDSEFANTWDADFKTVLREVFNSVDKIGANYEYFLTDFTNESGRYTFKLNYAVDGIPVVFNRAGRLPEADSAVEVILEKGQIRHRWFALGYEVLETEYGLSSDHDSIINAIFANEHSTDIRLNIEDIRLVYQSFAGVPASRLPVWLVHYKANGEKKSITVDAVKDRS